ncbi:MAG: D-tyrosyl-tRNA(Tyr) deacylase [Bacteroidales bacterium]|nr:D-tyrosyl-tRNA(Tyr) deacylase [Bacteroidales bacterium]MBO7142152.1 D-tyrosyl-tRNA(Tyr) deacylase [Bacteroidales bacterium]
MKIVVQRVTQASVTIDGKVKGEIKDGFMILAGFVDDDTDQDLEWIAGKIVGLRVFNDQQGVMNLSIQDTGGDILLISQFTLHALTKKGNRPSYIMAAKPEIAKPLYNKFIGVLEKHLGKPISTGEFGADMKVSLLNDGPVTIIIDSKDRK